ncbi:MAG: rRNA pseudouridine synthase [Prevotellaceae bacterium]|nr:rRNA pseudouridine synthase [Prevotellaceae bacterium]
MSEMEEWQDLSPVDKSSNGNDATSGREGYRSFNRDNNFGHSRPRFNNNGGERPRRPRFNNGGAYGQQRDGGYMGSSGQQNGFRPEGFGNRPSGGYNQRASHYGQRSNYGYDNGGYGSRGYRQSSDNNFGGGYGQQRGGYGQQRPQYGQQRGGYGQQRGGYGQQRPQRGGYGQPNRRQQGGYNPNAKYSMKKRIEYKEYIDDPDAPLRLNKYLANAGVCSRREADQFIEAGVVKVNGEVVTELGTKVLRTDTVHFHDQLVSMEKKVYVLLNKPKDYVTTSDDPQQRKTVMDLVKNCCRERIYPVGRLDRNTTGVLLLTNDGDLASKLTHPKYLKKKIYHVFLDKNCTAADLRQIADGITLEDGEVHADAISFASDTDKKQVGIEIHSGKNRIVRRIFESLGYRVLKLDRVMFCGLTKKGLKRGDWRFLTEQEVAMLHMGSYE